MGICTFTSSWIWTLDVLGVVFSILTATTVVFRHSHLRFTATVTLLIGLGIFLATLAGPTYLMLGAADTGGVGSIASATFRWNAFVLQGARGRTSPALERLPRSQLRLRAVIDLMWHTFLLFTQDCTRYFGFFVHHQPRTRGEKDARERRVAEDSDAALRERRVLLRGAYETVCDELGIATLRKWCDEFPARFSFETDAEESVRRHACNGTDAGTKVRMAVLRKLVGREDGHPNSRFLGRSPVRDGQPT